MNKIYDYYECGDDDDDDDLILKLGGDENSYSDSLVSFNMALKDHCIILPIHIN